MKRLILAGVLGCFGIVSADSDVSGKEAFAGFNVGAGLIYVHSKADVDLGAYSGVRFALPDSSRKISKNNCGGYVEVRYGNFVSLSDWYVGANVVVDFNKKSKKESVIANATSKISVEQLGIIPSVSVMFGRYICAVDALVFAEFGAFKSFCKVCENAITAVDSRKTFSNNRISPVVGLGVEKMVNSALGVRASWSYRLPSSKCQYVGSVGNGSVWCDVKSSAHVVRVGCVYHF